jgi:hypothetical protein
MRSIEKRYKTIQQNYPQMSDYLSLKYAVKSQNFTRRIISEHFRKLVDKDEYSSEVRQSLISILYRASKEPEENVFGTKSDSGAIQTQGVDTFIFKIKYGVLNEKSN